MKATFALLANPQVYNYVRKLAWEIHQTYHTGFGICRLPPHISLKQPFEISDLMALETCMGELAASISPFDVNLTELQLIPSDIDGVDTAILWIDIQETNYLRQLHDRINQELEQRFNNTQAYADGASYHFHMSVAIGGQPIEVYKKVYDEIPDRVVNLKFTAHELAMFVYDEPIDLEGNYMTYKILSLGKLSRLSV
jgi:2'-5' RNA ligase